MKTTLSILLVFLTINVTFAQSQDDREAVEAACLGYIEGFYEGDTTKLINSLRPTLNKFGFWKKTNSSSYEYEGPMTFNDAKSYAKEVKEKKQFPPSDAPKRVEVLDVMNHIASAKVTAWWGTDYLLLSKNGGEWKIEQVIWEGPLEK